MNNTPPGWDGDIPEELIKGAKGLRQMFVALMSAGFTKDEAALIIAHLMAANNPIASTGD